MAKSDALAISQEHDLRPPLLSATRITTYESRLMIYDIRFMAAMSFCKDWIYDGGCLMNLFVHTETPRKQSEQSKMFTLLNQISSAG